MMMLICCLAWGSIAASSLSESSEAEPDSVIRIQVEEYRPWYKQLVDNGFHINDPGIRYPRFARFCVNVYNWGDRTFNSYNPEYVEGTGKNWKALVRSFNRMETYALFFEDDQRMNIRSDIYPDFGIHLCFMAVSIGYTFKPNSLLGHAKNNRENLDFSFTCALFAANISYSSYNGGSVITRMGDYEGGRHIQYHFDGITQKSLTGNLYYFFNHKKYSQAAAYCFSKYQLKSAGSWIAGISFSHQNIHMNFESLPDEMVEHLPDLSRQYTFRYTDYDILGGYAYNWVLKPRRWLINVTFLPSIGFKRSKEITEDNRETMFSMNVMGRLAGVYNHRSLFASLEVNSNAFVNFARNYTFINSFIALSFNVGVRF